MYRKVLLAILMAIAALSFISCGTDYETMRDKNFQVLKNWSSVKI